MKRVFLSLPMSGYTEEEIDKNIAWMVKTILDSKIFKDEEVLFFDNSKCLPSAEQMRDAKTVNLLYLGSAIMTMAEMDAIVFFPDFKEAKGCMVECYVAHKYGIDSYFIEPDTDGPVICKKHDLGIYYAGTLYNHIEW